MAKHWPQSPQTTVSIVPVFEKDSGLSRTRMATPSGFTSAALDVDGSCDRLCGRHYGIQSSEVVALPR